tara:strand:- start:2650 stop:2877 length:228 start_codon:yes stop_codon:yes gene_type:complete
MSSVKEHFRYKNQANLYNNNISSLYPLNAISKKANIFELMAQANLEKKNKNKSNLKYFSIFASIAASVVLFYSLH